MLVWFVGPATAEGGNRPLITPEKRVEAAALVKQGVLVSASRTLSKTRSKNPDE
tara:strand:- start:3 stop:164 length:162 start_codon:yes stop_codon:yes gene_type:complete